MYKNVIIKLSGEALMGDTCVGEYKPYDDAVVMRLIGEIAEAVKAGVSVSLVIGGGNLWRGRDANPKMVRAKMDHMGMLATVMNAVYLTEAFALLNTKAVVMTPFTAGTFTELYDIDAAKAYLKNGTVVIFAGGSGLPFFSTDTITAVRGKELEVEAVLFAKNIDGIYSANPKTDKSAVKYDALTYDEIIKKDLEAIDISAISICKEQRLTSVVFALKDEGSITNAVNGKALGTVITV